MNARLLPSRENQLEAEIEEQQKTIEEQEKLIKSLDGQVAELKAVISLGEALQFYVPSKLPYLRKLYRDHCKK